MVIDILIFVRLDLSTGFLHQPVPSSCSFIIFIDSQQQFASSSIGEKLLHI